MNKKLRPNFTQIPNIFFDEWLPILEKGELKVLLYIMRRTYGFQKTKDRISFSQLEKGIKDRNGDKLDNGTGLHSDTLSRSINTLEKKCLIIVNREKNTNTYSLNLNYKSTPTIKVLLPQEQTTPTIGVKLLLPQDIQKKEKESIQNKDTAFASFWNSYPKKVNKKVCEGLWKSKKLNSKLEVILEFIQKAKKTERWELGYIKAPDVFLRNETWTDDLEAYKPIKATLKKSRPVNLLNYEPNIITIARN